MEKAKEITPAEEIMLTTEEIVTEAKEEVKEITAEVVDNLRPNKGPQLVSLRDTVSSKGFDDKRGWRRILALWGSTNSPFFR
jgi:putative aminopeptidase FrvX